MPYKQEYRITKVYTLVYRIHSIALARRSHPRFLRQVSTRLHTVRLIRLRLIISEKSYRSEKSPFVYTGRIRPKE